MKSERFKCMKPIIPPPDVRRKTYSNPKDQEEMYKIWNWVPVLHTDQLTEASQAFIISF